MKKVEKKCKYNMKKKTSTSCCRFLSFSLSLFCLFFPCFLINIYNIHSSIIITRLERLIAALGPSLLGLHNHRRTRPGVMKAQPFEKVVERG